MPQPTTHAATGARLTRLRLEAGYSQDQMAREYGCSKSVVRTAERGGDTRPSTRKMIAEYWHIPVTELWPS